MLKMQSIMETPYQLDAINMKTKIFALLKQIVSTWVSISFIFVSIEFIFASPYGWIDEWYMNFIFIIYYTFTNMFHEVEFIPKFILLLYFFRGIVYFIKPTFKRDILLFFGGLSGIFSYLVFKVLESLFFIHLGSRFIHDTYFVLGFILVGIIFFIFKPVFKNEQKEP